jgi:hypothetical protein
MSGDESTSSRRNFLELIASGALAAGGFSLTEAGQALEGQKENQEAPLGLTTSDEAQYCGGPMNQSYRDTPQSAVGVDNIVKVSDQETSYAPITNPDGITASVQYHDGNGNSHITFTDIQNQEILNQIQTTPGANPGMWHNNNYIIGTARETAKHTIDGEKINSIDGSNQGAIGKHGQRGYSSKGHGITDYNLNNLTENKKQEFVGNPPIDSLTIVDEGDVLAMFSYRNLVAQDVPEQETIDDPSIPMHSSVSSDGKNIVSSTENGLTIYDIPMEKDKEFEVVDSASFEGGIDDNPPIIAERNNEKYVISGTEFNDEDFFAIQGYKFENGNLDNIWSEQVEGPIKQLVGVNNTIIAGADNLYGLDLETGEKLFEEDIDGKPGMPHGKYLPVGTEDGTYVLEMDVGEVPSQQEPTTTTTPEPTPTETDTPEPTTTEPTTTDTPEPDPTTETTLPTTETSTDTPTTETTIDTPNGSTDTPNNSTTSPEPNTDTANGDGPGFGTLTGLAGIVGGAGYAAKRLLEDEEDQ